MECISFLGDKWENDIIVFSKTECKKDHLKLFGDRAILVPCKKKKNKLFLRQGTKDHRFQNVYTPVVSVIEMDCVFKLKKIFLTICNYKKILCLLNFNFMIPIEKLMRFYQPALEETIL